MRRYVFTGGPGVGKTTLLNALKNEGYSILEETARNLIEQEKEKHKINSEYAAILPATHPYEFEINLYDFQKEQESAVPYQQDVLFDRSLVDIVAFSSHFGIHLPRDTNKDIESAGYTTVFLLDPLDSYEDDGLRRETKKEAQIIHNLISDTYQNYGFELVNVPNIGKIERLDYLKNYLSDEVLGTDTWKSGGN